MQSKPKAEKRIKRLTFHPLSHASRASYPLSHSFAVTALPEGEPREGEPSCHSPHATPHSRFSPSSVLSGGKSCYVPKDAVEGALVLEAAMGHDGADGQLCGFQ